MKAFVAGFVRETKIFPVAKLTVVVMVAIVVMQGDVQIERGSGCVTKPNVAKWFFQQEFVTEAAPFSVKQEPQQLSSLGNFSNHPSRHWHFVYPLASSC
jgi:hypothetical protein